jgi:hypothetical protein
MATTIESWLTERVSVEQAEMSFTPLSDQLASRSQRPNAFVKRERHLWETLKSHMVEGDELWYFCSPQETWPALRGRYGIALVRNGRAIETIILLMS